MAVGLCVHQNSWGSGVKEVMARFFDFDEEFCCILKEGVGALLQHAKWVWLEAFEFLQRSCPSGKCVGWHCKAHVFLRKSFHKKVFSSFSHWSQVFA